MSSGITASQVLTNSVYTSVATPGGITNPAQIFILQTPYNAPSNPSIETITNGLNVPPIMSWRFRNFSENVYTLNPTDHVVRFTKVLLGQAGAGQYRSRSLAAQLQSTLNGANFYDLDGFYGNLFGIQRSSTEVLSNNPYTGLDTYENWASVRSQNSSYVGRIDQFTKAIALCPTTLGMQEVAEAILDMPVTIIEQSTDGYALYKTYGYLQTYGPGSTIIVGGATWGSLEVDTYAQLQGTAMSASTSFIISPSQTITDQQEYALRAVIDTLKPANVAYTVAQTGSSSLNPITLRGVYSDSSYWNLVESIIPVPEYAGLYNLSPNADANGFFEILRPINSEYQGELIVYNNDIQSIASGVNPDNMGSITSASETDSVVFYDGSIGLYPPSNGLASRLSYLSARLVSDGILQGNILSAEPAYTSTTDILANTGYSPPSGSNVANPLNLYVDGVSLYNLTQILNGGNLGSEDASQRFWATPRRLSSDNTTETMQIGFSAPKLINEISFDLAHYPQFFEIWAEINGTWQSVYNTTIVDSVPAVLPATQPNVHEHPQHMGNEHWDSIIAEFAAITTQSIQIRITRIPSMAAPIQQPISPTGVAQTVYVPYSLGVRNMSLNYSVASQSDLPAEPLFSKDALGSRTEWTVRQETSDRALSPSTDTGAWRSAPQYSSNSVVNFYLDTRTANGQPQVIDTIYIDPLYPGPHISLYYSDQSTADLGYAAEYTEFVPPLSSISGAIVGAGDGLEFSAYNSGYAQIENAAMQWDPTQPWWIGTVIWPQFASQNCANQVVWDTQSGMSLILLPPTDGTNNAQVTLTIANGATATYPIEWDAGDNLTLAVAYIPDGNEDFIPGIWLFAAVNYATATPDEDPENWVGMFAQTNLTNYVHPEIEPVSESSGQPNRIIPPSPNLIVNEQPVYLLFGGSPSCTIPASFVLSNLIVKQETAAMESLNLFAENPSNYVVTSQYANGVPGLTTTNAVVRFDPSFISTTNPAGMVGGPGDFYENLTWQPIPRDYTASKGYLMVPPTNASFWKLEFTNLVAQPINIVQPIQRTYRTLDGLPSGTVSKPENISTTNFGGGPAGSKVLQSTKGNNSLVFGDSTYIPKTSPVPGSIPPTATQTIPDIQVQQSQAQSAWYWQYQNAAQSTYAPKFIQGAVHEYNSGTVFHGTQVGYFTGLNSIQVYRTSSLSTLNSVYYDEFFLDEEMIQSSTWNQNPGDMNSQGIISFSGASVQATSTPLLSSAPVAGVQFATSQSEAAQLAYDDSFMSGFIRDPAFNWHNPTLPNSIGYLNTSTNSWVSYGDGNLALNNSSNCVTITRSQTFAPVAPTSDMIQPIDHPILATSASVNYFITATAGDGATYQQYTVSSNSPTQPFSVGQIVTVTNTTNSYNVANAPITAVGGTSGAWWFEVAGSTANSSSTGNAQIVVSDSNYGGMATSWIAPATTWATQSQYTSGTELWAAVKITGISNITGASPLFLEIVDAGATPSYNPTVLTSLPIKVSPGQTVEASVGVIVNSTNYVYAQIVQRGPSTDSWIVNQLSVFDEGVYWSFSNDGANWYRSDKIRNRFDSQMTFPTAQPQLQWRATATRPNVHVNGLRVRPVYAQSGIRFPQGTRKGPNLSFFEAVPPVEDDPLFNAWSNPVPNSWYNSSYSYDVGNPNGTLLPNQFTSNYFQSMTDSISGFSDSATANYILPTTRTGNIALSTTFSVATEESYNTSPSDSMTGLTDSATAFVVVLPQTSQMVYPIIQDLSE